MGNFGRQRNGFFQKRIRFGVAIIVIQINAVDIICIDRIRTCFLRFGKIFKAEFSFAFVFFAVNRLTILRFGFHYQKTRFVRYFQRAFIEQNVNFVVFSLHQQ